MDLMETKAKIRKFIESNLVVFEDEAVFSDSDNIFQMGFVNSLFAMKMINFIETEFALEIPSEDLDIPKFSSVDRITEYIQGKLKS